MSTYQPASCNIGRRQRKRRLAVAVAAFAAAAVYVGAVAGGFLPRPLLVGVFAPLAVGFEWAIQASTGFCVRLALLSRYDFRTSGDGEASGAVSDPAHRRADREYAAKLTIAGAVLAGVTTALAWVAV
ncbi:hypothetical protein ACFQMA_21265 [Halosimplex aquaticum]|uniref:DUF2892 domain-containing protein n=1 Tax=Halosimplex aquaticum TaxID=3026162 RepID=A0ABD5Y8Z6_9EURY|nr:hypothetical protein [Halosimplex aquaticum]